MTQYIMNFVSLSLQVEKSLQRIQSGQCNPMYTSQQSVENKVCACAGSPELLNVNSCILSAHVRVLFFLLLWVRLVACPDGRPSCPQWVFGWTSLVAVLVSLRRFSFPRQTLETGCNSAAPLCSPCLVPQLVH